MKNIVKPNNELVTRTGGKRDIVKNPVFLPVHRHVLQLPALLFFFLLVLSGCSEVIDWQVEENQVRLVVEGRVTNEYKRHSVYLSLSQDVYEEKHHEGLSQASVTISDGENSYSLNEDTERRGFYQTTESFAGKPGMTYQLDVMLEEPLSGIQNYQAAALMPRLLEFDSINVVKETFFGEEGYAVRVFGQDSATTADYYLMHVYRNDILLTDKLDDIILLDNETMGDFIFNNLTIYRNDEITEGDHIQLEVQSLTKGYYTYLSNLAESQGGSDPFGFSGPPSNVIGNISDGAFGYFYAAPVSTLEGIAAEK